jgi:hypothetical protein
LPADVIKAGTYSAAYKTRFPDKSRLKKMIFTKKVA